MAKATFDNRPELIEQEGEQMRINFDITEEEQEFPQMGDEEPVKRTVYKAEVVRVPLSADYSTIIDAIVRCHYTQSQVEAIQLNNFGVDEPTEEHKAQMVELQAWRDHAKEVAKEVLGIE